jgi:hypothetical protein
MKAKETLNEILNFIEGIKQVRTEIYKLNIGLPEPSGLEHYNDGYSDALETIRLKIEELKRNEIKRTTPYTNCR